MSARVARLDRRFGEKFGENLFLFFRYRATFAAGTPRAYIPRSSRAKRALICQSFLINISINIAKIAKW